MADLFGHSTTSFSFGSDDGLGSDDDDFGGPTMTDDALQLSNFMALYKVIRTKELKDSMNILGIAQTEDKIKPAIILFRSDGVEFTASRMYKDDNPAYEVHASIYLPGSSANNYVFTGSDNQYIAAAFNSTSMEKIFKQAKANDSSIIKYVDTKLSLAIVDIESPLSSGVLSDYSGVVRIENDVIGYSTTSKAMNLRLTSLISGINNSEIQVFTRGLIIRTFPKSDALRPVEPRVLCIPADSYQDSEMIRVHLQRDTPDTRPIEEIVSESTHLSTFTNVPRVFLQKGKTMGVVASHSQFRIFYSKKNETIIFTVPISIYGRLSLQIGKTTSSL